MQLVPVKDFDEMSRVAAEKIIQQVRACDSLTLGLATGGTPLKTYQYLIQDFQENETTYKHVRTFNLDEYIGLSPDDPNSYHHYMNDHLFHHIDIPKENIHLPNGLAPNPQEEANRYENLIQKSGGIDIQLLGLGENGHIGFNEPGTSFQKRTHIADLTESTRKANARYFKSYKDVPTRAITMGINSILQSKEILLLASGKNKAAAINELFNSKQNKLWPVTALQTHKNVTIIADQEALSSIRSKVN